LSFSPEAGVSPASRTDKPRERALIILHGIERGGFVDPLLEDARKEFGVLDSAFILELVYGVLRNRSLLDWTLDRFSEKPIARTDAWTRNILRIAAYQLIHLDRVPVSAAVNTATELAKGHGKKSGYVNGLLRTFERNKTALPLPPAENPLSRLSVLYSHPAWLVRRWIERLGMQTAEEVLRNNNRHAPLIVRTNALKGKRGDLLSLLQNQGAVVRESPYSPAGIEILSSPGIAVLPAYKDGWFMIQDEAAQLVGMMLSPQEGETVLDACAAPGGKATHLAELMGDQGSVVALESDKKRMVKIRENSSRLGIKIIRLVLGDAAAYKEGTYDRVLIDAPCSGLGVLRRHPDGRWTKTEKSISERASLQKRILVNCAKLVKPGGVLVYATCTTEPEENETVVTAFLAEHLEFALDDARPYLPGAAAPLVGPDGFFRTFPDAPAMDGFFGARLVRRE
jgi:16S rRNA (cytosine967-C5)-methyltransferase